MSSGRWVPTFQMNHLHSFSGQRNPEGGGNCSVQNVGMYLAEYMMSYQADHGHKCRKCLLFASLYDGGCWIIE